MSYTLQVRCWYCRDIFPLEVTPNTDSDKLIALTTTCPECQEPCDLTVYRQQLIDVALVNGQAPQSLAEIPSAQLSAHVFGAKQPI